MDAPTEWTYGGQLDFSSADTLKLAPTGMAIRCIVEDLKEKAAVTSYTLPSLLSADWNPLNIPYDVASAIQGAVTALMALFVNHTDAGGDWSGLSDANDIAPAWTEADILGALGVESRIIPPRLGLLREWVYQQYQILNLLRWVKNSARLTSTGTYLIKEGNGSGGDAISNYNSCEWGTIYPLYLGAARSVGWVNEPDEDYRGEQIRRGKLKLHHAQSGTICNSYDIYVYSAAIPTSYESTFNSQGDSVIEDAYSKLTATAEMTETTDFYVLDTDSAPPNCPPWIYPETPYNKTYGWAAGSSISVAKFDGANGFKFRDW